ncbi:MAG: hypothetical protein R3F46_08680 [bacterium]
MRNLIILLLIGIVWPLGSCQSTGKAEETGKAGETNHPDKQSLIALMDARTRQIQLPLQQMPLQLTYLELDSEGESIDPLAMRGGMALQRASTYYAISTGDYEVTVQELLGNGFWPYSTFQESELDLLVPSFDKVTMNMSDLGPSILEMESSEFTLYARYRILHDFYRFFFFADSTEEDTEQYFNDLLSNPVSAFWINPENQSIMENSLKRGDFTLGSINDFKDTSPAKEFDLSVRTINLLSASDKAESQTSLNCGFYFVDQCGSSLSIPSGWSRDFVECFGDICPNMPCYVEFTLGGGTWGYTKYVFVACRPCTTSPLSGEIKVSHGSSPPANIYGGVSATITGDTCVVYPRASAVDPDAWDDYNNFKTGLGLSNPVGSKPNPPANCP